MTTLIVQAHPVQDSYNTAMLDAVIAGLDEHRLVRIGQGDQLTADSFIGATHFIAVYPTWWGSVPAMMLAALTDLLGPWVDGGEPGDTSPLRSITQLTAVTSHGGSKLINMVQGEAGLHLWNRTVLPLCAPDAHFRWHSIYQMDQASEAARRDFLEQLSAGLFVEIRH